MLVGLAALALDSRIGQRMCGVVGYVGAKEHHADVLRAMTQALAHRGPDGEGVFLSEFAGGRLTVGLGHRRLSIIDLAGGQQPMSGAAGSVQLIFNGEIYNHNELRHELRALGLAFHTSSDTEVLLRSYEAWGDKCIDRLRGMFAFAIWDARQERLLLARDRFGEKPLYFAEVDGTLLFASELGALMRWPGFTARLNHRVLPQYLQYRYVPGPATWVQGIQKLQPGCTLVWTASGWFERRYFRPADATAAAPPPDYGKSIPAMLLDTLSSTVKMQMQADVPYGAFLSGGLDSSAIVALMASHTNAPVKTFSVGFAESAFSELPYANTVAKALGTSHHELVLSAQDLIDAMPQAALHRDAPMSEPADVPMFLLAREARKHVKLVLTGEGSDEAFGGYPKHLMEPFATYYQKLPFWLRTRFIEKFANGLPFAASRVKTAVSSLSLQRFEERMPRWFGALSPNEIEALCGEGSMVANGLPLYPFEGDQLASPLRRILYFDQTSWLPDNLLERADRMTMAWGLESRMPFMDQQVMALASALPDQWRTSGFKGKRALRQACFNLLPASILKRKKVGFSMPIALWLRTTMRDEIGDRLLGPDSVVGQLLGRTVVRRYIEDHNAGRINREKLIWTLLNLEIWVKARGVTI